ncbi:MAG TPA: FecR domain-containing protein [Chitinophagaceae bacterium]|nr:FecR domain-containing protein [Chitinophagaceae bacterium]
MNEMNEQGADRVAYLVAGYIRQTLTEKEHDELDEWITANNDNQRLFEELTDPVTIQRGLEKFDASDADIVLHRIKNKIRFKEPKRTPKRKWMLYGVAASVILLAGIILFQVMNKKRKADSTIAKTNKIQPGGNFATLTLGDGRRINLFESKNGLIDSTNGNEVLKSSDGQINYVSTSVASNAYHLLTTPTGGQYSVLLPDSTRVWLNSSSSLKYPVSFSEKERVVELTGEGYFEVARHLTPNPSPLGEGNRKIPFIVKVGNMSVEVLGTHFNVNAYSDEPMIRTTLLEGKVVVSSETSKVKREMVPGEQATLMKNGEWKIENAVDVEEVIAWKNGMFLFRDSEIENVMRQIGRWYNAEIVYEGKVDHHFNATLYRKEPIDKLLHFLEETNEVHFKVEGRKIVVRP